MKNRLLTWIPELVVALFVLLFVYTGLNKLQYMDGFEAGMEHNPLLNGYTHLLAWLIPTIELSITTLLIIPVTRRLGLLSATLLMLSFAGFIIYMMLKLPTLPCICGGIFNNMLWGWHLAINAAFVILGIFSIIVYKKPFIAINRRSRTPVEPSRHSLTN